MISLATPTMSLFGSQLFVSSVSLQKIDDGSKMKPFRVRDSFDLMVDRNRSCVYPPKSDIRPVHPNCSSW